MMTSMAFIIAKRLKELRHRSGLSAAEVAHRLGVAVSTYREWEQGRKIQGEPYLKLARIFRVSLSEILSDGSSRDSIHEELSKIEAAIQAIRSKL